MELKIWPKKDQLDEGAFEKAPGPAAGGAEVGNIHGGMRGAQ